MISIGMYLIECDTFKCEPDSKLRHELVNALIPYWVRDQRSKFLVDKKSKKKLKIVLDKI